MAQSQFSLAWDSFKSNICNGFSALQQNGEFVDMTLAADGHLVKVHQVLVALASPYLKEMIGSAPCPHPVIYLNNISHKVLCYLLEYIYTGEATVPSECLPAFAEAAKSLHIKGLENINGSKDYMQSSAKLTSTPRSTPAADSSAYMHSAKRKAPEDQRVALPSAARKIFIKAEGPISMDELQSADDTHDLGDITEDALDSDDDGFRQDQPTPTLDMEKLRLTASNLLFTVSIRGCLQVILNRYIYNLNSATSRSGQRRWRCVDYRNNKCSAFIITKGNIVVNSHDIEHGYVLDESRQYISEGWCYSMEDTPDTEAIENLNTWMVQWLQDESFVVTWCVHGERHQTTNATESKHFKLNPFRANVHSHPFHDKKILAKLEKKSVFSAIDEVEAYKEKEREIEEKPQITVDIDALDK